MGPCCLCTIQPNRGSIVDSYGEGHVPLTTTTDGHKPTENAIWLQRLAGLVKGRLHHRVIEWEKVELNHVAFRSVHGIRTEGKPAALADIDLKAAPWRRRRSRTRSRSSARARTRVRASRASVVVLCKNDGHDRKKEKKTVLRRRSILLDIYST